MKSRSTLVLIFMLSLASISVTLPFASNVSAWGLSTHTFIVSEAMSGISDENWSRAFSYYSGEILEGCVTPDTVWQDWDNHLYYPETGEYDAPEAAQRWFNYTRDNFTLGNWEEGFFAAGVMTHYFSDPCIPVHTGPYWDGHAGYESDINSNLEELDISEPSETIIENISQTVVDCATYSHQYYETVFNAYDGEDSTALDDPQIKALTEDCLSMAINGCLSLFYTLTQNVDAPDVSYTYDYVALVDYAHSNDYIDFSGQDQLTSLNHTLAVKHYEMKQQFSPFTSNDLEGVDLLIITCALDSYTSDELDAISTWASSGEKSLLITGRGDFSTYTDNALANSVLQAVDSNIRINDDNVYMEGTYQDWYNDLTDIPEPTETLGLTQSVDSLTMFSPTSLYFLDDEPILPVLYADETAYQTDQNTPNVTVIYDDTIDSENGDQIPLASIEQIGDLRLLVTGTTFFSNFDYGKTAQFDNIEFLENFLDWASGQREQDLIPEIDEVGPRIGIVGYNQVNNPQGSVTFHVEVTDPSGVESVLLEYNADGSTKQAEMSLDDGDTYSVSLEISEDTQVTVIAEDVSGNIATRGSYPISVDGGTQPIDNSMMLVLGSIAVVAIIAVLVVFIRRG